MSEFELKDSGVRQEFDSGMVRDTQEGKILYRLIRTGPMFKRWAIHLTKGALKYSRDNWTLAAGEAELERFKDSATRHFEQWLDGETDEDHASAVFFNINGAEYVKEKLVEVQPVCADALDRCGFDYVVVGCPVHDTGSDAKSEGTKTPMRGQLPNRLKESSAPTHVSGCFSDGCVCRQKPKNSDC